MKKKIRKLILWLQDKKNSKNHLIRDGGILFIGQIITSILGVGLTIGFANLLPQNEYGTYRFLLSGLSILSAFSLSGLQAAVTRSVARGFEKTFIYAYKKQLYWSVFPSVLSLGISLYYHLQSNSILSIGFLIIALLFSFLKSGEIFEALLVGSKKFKLKVKYNVWQTLIVTGLTLTSLMITNNVLIILVTYIGATTLCLNFFYFKTKKRISNEAIDMEMMSHGKHLTVLNGINQIAQEIDKVLLFHFLGAAQLAQYSLAIAAPLRIDGLKLSLKTLIFPKLATTNISLAKKILPKKVLLLTIFTIFIAGIYILLAPIIFELLLPRYLESIQYSQIFILSIIFSPTILVFNQALTAQAKNKSLYKVRTIQAFFKITLVLTLVTLLNVWGAIYAYIAAQAIYAIVITIIFYQTN